MKTQPAWDDYSLFVAVAQSGSLSAAAQNQGTSVPTLSRRMRRFEAELGRPLFQHGSAGYQLTADGRALLDHLTPMQAASETVSRWLDERRGPTPIRISAGTWTARRLAQDAPLYWNDAALWVPEFVSSNLDLDLPRREIDIGIRNRRPDQPWLAARRTKRLDFAPYAAKAGITGWIAIANSTAPSARWLADQSAARVVTRVNDPTLALELARAGVAQVILPQFIGAREPGIVQTGPRIDALSCDEWLVCHQDNRHTGPIRHALDALADYLSAKPKP